MTTPDVAIISWQSQSRRSGGTQMAMRCSREYNENHWQTQTFGEIPHYKITDIRPLVVIDPEDREQVKRLGDALADAFAERHPEVYEVAPDLADEDDDAITRQALRSLVAPLKPDEPQGLGAVVEDGFGVLWIRHGSGPAPWMVAGAPPSNRDTYPWSGIVAVKILSDGVQ